MNFLSRVNFRNQQEGEPIRTFLREPMEEQITKSQSQRRCHCYGPVRAPASWFLGGRHGGHFGRPLGIASWLAALSPALLPACISQFTGPTLGRGCGPAARLSLSLLLRRGLGGAARCSRRARPRRIPPLTGTSPLSPQQTRKVRLGPRRARHPGGRRADTAGCF